jgi:hypothetical protein
LPDQSGRQSRRPLGCSRMEDAKTDQEWCGRIGNYSASTLVVAGLLNESQQERAAAIISEEVLVRLLIGDRPPSK